MIVLSLFDGMSCGQIALRDMGITIERYYASEIDKFAIQNTMANFPETVQLGDVRQIDATTLGHIDLLIGGSPCQSFSFAGKRVGMKTATNEKILTLERYMELKEAGFEFVGQSYLFWEYVRVLHQVRQTNPGILFLLENVEMGKQWEAVINHALGVQGVHINSALVSAQVRKRIYWTNIRTFKTDCFAEPISAIPQPKDRHIFLKDILEDEVPERYFLKEQVIKNLLEHRERNKAKGNGFGAVFHTGGEDGSTENRWNWCGRSGSSTNKKFLKMDYKGNISANQKKANCISTKNYHSDMDLICVAQRGHEYRGEPSHLIPSTEPGKTNCLTTVAKDNLILQRPRGKNKGGAFSEKAPTLTGNSWEQNNLVVEMKDESIKQINPSKESGSTQPYQQNRVYDPTGKAPALMDGHGGRTINTLAGGDAAEQIRVRRLTPTECARLQTIPTWYKWTVSETQQHKMLGNGWTVEVIKHIFSFLPDHLKR
jgi:DNA (cytosine-5)-methyltransferase 3A